MFIRFLRDYQAGNGRMYQGGEVLDVDKTWGNTLVAEGAATLTLNGDNPIATVDPVSKNVVGPDGVVRQFGQRQSMITVACGNSIAAQSQKGYAGAGGWHPIGELPYANMFADSPLRFARMTATTRSDLYGVYGYSGQTLATINADLDAQWFGQFVTAGVTPELVIGLALLENDLAQGATSDQCVSRINTWIANVRRYPGVVIMLCTPRPSFSYDTAAKVSAYQNITKYIQSLDDGRSLFVATVQTYEDPSNPGKPLPGYTDGVVHPQVKGAMTNGRVMADTLRRISYTVTQPYRVLSSNYGLTGSTAATGTNHTGTTPTGCSWSGSANGVGVSVANDPSWTFSISQTAGAAGDINLLATPSTPISGGAGTQVSAFAKVQIVSGAEYLRYLSIDPRINDGGGNTFQYYASMQTALDDGDYKNGDVLTLRAPPMMASSGSITVVQVYLRPNLKTGGSGTVTVTGTVVLKILDAGVGLVVA